MPGDEGVPKLLINSPVNSFWPPASPLPFEVEVFTSGYAITRIVTLQAGLNEPSFLSRNVWRKLLTLPANVLLTPT